MTSMTYHGRNNILGAYLTFLLPIYLRQLFGANRLQILQRVIVLQCTFFKIKNITFFYFKVEKNFARREI